jgi:uncharacterized protein (DUF983 family)
MPNCPKCERSYTKDQKACQNCGFKFRPFLKEKGFPPVFYPIIILFGIYLLWELGEILFSSR